jgi:hypothetical protein
MAVSTGRSQRKVVLFLGRASSKAVLAVELGGAPLAGSAVGPL